jgi:hypothetical protein
MAGRIGARLVFLIRLCVDRFHVLVDLLDDHAEARELLGIVLLLRL